MRPLFYKERERFFLAQGHGRYYVSTMSFYVKIKEKNKILFIFEKFPLQLQLFYPHDFCCVNIHFIKLFGYDLKSIFDFTTPATSYPLLCFLPACANSNDSSFTAGSILGLLHGFITINGCFRISTFPLSS